MASALEDGFFEMGTVCSFVFLLDVVVFGAFREKLASGSSDSGWALGLRCFSLDLGWLEELSVPLSLLRVFRGCCRIVASTETTSSCLGGGDLSGEDIVISLSSNAFELVGTKRLNIPKRRIDPGYESDKVLTIQPCCASSAHCVLSMSDLPTEVIPKPPDHAPSTELEGIARIKSHRFFALGLSSTLVQGYETRIRTQEMQRDFPKIGSTRQ